MPSVEHALSSARPSQLRMLILGRVIPHTLAVWYVLFFLTRSIDSLHANLPLFMLAYGFFAFGHSLASLREFRFPVVLAASGALALLLFGLVKMVTINSEAGSYFASFYTGFLGLLLGFSALHNYFFIRWRWYYLVEIALFFAVWIGLVAGRAEEPVGTVILYSLPLLAYALYVMVFMYAAAKPFGAEERKKILHKYVGVLILLVLGFLLSFLTGPASTAEPPAVSYSLMSSSGNMYKMQDRAAMEDEYKIPLDSKELVFIANIDPSVINGKENHLGYYLKFHSLYNYDGNKGEFNSFSDELESPAFRLRTIDLKDKSGIPIPLTVNASGSPVIPPYQMRVDGRATIYNVKLSVEQSFSNNVTYRFVAYPGKDSVTVGEATYPVLGVYRLFNKISLFNIFPVGTSGQFFDFDYNTMLLQRVEEFPDLQNMPSHFRQKYLNYSNLERDIVDTVRALLQGKITYAEKINTIIGYFAAKDTAGKRVFTYDVKPGKPPDPNETRLHYFLMRSRRGYCTYYATAAALFLRIAGIPARVAIGFVPGQSSEKNPGWYNVYSQQGHAWTEVYLGPSLGWMDLDVTPASEDSRVGPPPPDPSPPSPPVPPEPVYNLVGVLAGKSDSLLAQCRLTLQKEEAEQPVCEQIQSKTVRLIQDTGAIDRAKIEAVYNDLAEGDTISALGRQEANPGVDSCAFSSFRYFALKKLQGGARDSSQAASQKEKDPGFRIPPIWLYLLGAAFLILLLLAPTIHKALLLDKAMHVKSEPRRLRLIREWLLMTLHLHSFPTLQETDLDFAGRMRRSLGVDTAPFFTRYLESRYYKEPTMSSYGSCVTAVDEVEEAVHSRLPWWKRALHAGNVWSYIRYINRKKTA